MSARPAGPEVQVGGRRLRLSNLDKVLWPKAGFTKGQLVDYYRRVADALVPHLAGRPVTLRRWPDGVEGESFFEKNCPSHKPPWVDTVEMGGVRYCLVEEPATVVWMANLAAIELHPGLARRPHLERPTAVVFDLDPGPPADLLTCVRVASLLRELLGQLDLSLWPKTSGGKGLQLYAPLNVEATYEDTKPFAHSVARLLEREHPELVTSTQQKSRRRGKVLIDWSQNTSSKTTVAVYSVRANAIPTVSTPVTWDELEDAVGGDPEALRFSPEEVLERLERYGDLHRPVLEVEQELPRLARP